MEFSTSILWCNFVTGWADFVFGFLDTKSLREFFEKFLENLVGGCKFFKFVLVCPHDK